MSKATASTLCALLIAAMPAAAQDPNVIQVGIVDSLVADISKDQRDFLVSEFTMLVHDFTGCKSKVALGGNPMAAAGRLEAGDWNFGVFQGVEFAQAQAKNPSLKPLIIATYVEPSIHALVVVRKDGKASTFTDLKGTDACILESKEHCRLFADKAAGGKAASFFSRLTKTRSVEKALDEVLGGKLQAAIVDNAAFKIYQDLNPGRHARLKVLAQSELFPSSVIAYRDGKLSEALLSRWRSGMLDANKSAKGQEVMSNFRISTFEPVPANYQETLTRILKAYPPK